MNTTEENFKAEVELVEDVYRQTQAVIDAMPMDGDGKRMQISAMTEAVAQMVGLPAKEILHMVNRYAHNNLDGYVTRGKKGGFIKGQKPVKTPAPGVVSTDDGDADDVAE